MFNVIKLDLFDGQEPTVIAQGKQFTDALLEVAAYPEEMFADAVAGGFPPWPHGELRPLANGGVAALKPYGTIQAWELRVDGERTALLAIQEEVEA